MHRGVYLLGVVAYLVVSLHSWADCAVRGNRRYGGRRKSYPTTSYSLEYRLHYLEGVVDQLVGEKDKLAQRLDHTQEAVKNLAEQECEAGEDFIKAPINTTLHIPFETPFDRPPKATVSLRGVSQFLLKYCQISVVGVSTKGLHLEAIAGGIDVNVYYSWMACPSAPPSDAERWI